MTLLYSEGFDKIYDKTQFTSFGIGQGSTSTTISTTGGRFGGRCAYLSGGSGGTEYSYVAIPAQDLTANKLHAAGWFYVKNNPNTRYDPLIAFVNRSVNYGIGVGVYNGNLEAFGWTSTSALVPSWTAASVVGSTALSADTWHHVEICCDVKDSGGTFKVWLDGTLAINFSGDTRYAAESSANAVNYLYFGFGYAGTGSWYIDDIICWNEAGDTFNTAGPLGEHRIWTLSPEGDNSCQFTPSTGSNRYAVVDDATLDTSDYNSSSVDGVIDRFSFGDLSVSPNTIHAINVKAIAKKTGTGGAQMRALVRQNDTDHVGASVTLTTSFAPVNVVFGNNPETSAAWTATSVNALIAGYEYLD